MPFGHPRSQIRLQKVPKVTPQGIPKHNPNRLDPQGVPGGVPVDHWITKWSAKRPKRSLQVLKMTPQRTEESFQLELLTHSNVNIEL